MNTAQNTEYTLLHVEDNLEIQDLVRFILTSRPSIKVMGALTAKEGLDLARQILPDMVLMDIHLPDGNGLDVLKQIRTCQETADIPVVAMSGLTDRLQIETSLKKGFKYYIAKPIDVPEMLETIDQILDGRPECTLHSSRTSYKA